LGAALLFKASLSPDCLNLGWADLFITLISGTVKP
jgi:hypothetical protein